ncbi:MAG: hypothetical protein Q8M65_11875 [Rhodoglobus sp.]|nr:hypothetical protein [Rhodoglobus sp.]
MPQQKPRHIEIAPSRAQRRARPKAAYAIVTVSSLFMIFAAQLLLSIVVSGGAYQIEHLQTQQKELLRSQEALTEKLDLSASTQSLAANAANLGMVPGANPLFLDLSTGAVSGAPGSVDRAGCGGACNLVANALLAGAPLVNRAGPTAATTPGTVPPTTTTAAVGSPQPVEALPAPVTH